MKVPLKQGARDAVNDFWESVSPNPKDRQFAYHLPNSLYLAEGGLTPKGRRISLMTPAIRVHRLQASQVSVSAKCSHLSGTAWATLEAGMEKHSFFFSNQPGYKIKKTLPQMLTPNFSR